LKRERKKGQNDFQNCSYRVFQPVTK
jgi:hypothetical protein